MSRSVLRLAVPTLALAVLFSCGPDPVDSEVGESAAAVDSESAPSMAGDSSVAELGDGFVVWESNRTGDWRIWYRELDGGGLRQLSADEPGMQHCCPHVSPDGRRVAYLSRAVPKDRYPESEIAGELRVITLGEGHEAREEVVVERARSYGWGNRAAVWRSDDELVYIAGDGRSALLDLTSGESRYLTDEKRPDEMGWLVNHTLTHATTAAPSFSIYDEARRRVVPRAELGGCEAYFSADGRWGYWVPGAGGPIDRIDLESREMSTILRKNDPRLGDEKGYLYFPMLSHDGRLFAWGASAGGHNHWEADYDVFVAAVDAETLELVGEPVAITDHPGVDRYPDAHLRPLALGRHRGEAPLRIDFPTTRSLGSETVWEFGDGASARGAEVSHTYREPGTYAVLARQGDRTLRGHVVVAPGRPPRVTDTGLAPDATAVIVRFDEQIEVAAAEARLASGRPVEGIRAGDGRRSLVVALRQPLEERDRLHLSGVTDRDGRVMSPVRLDLAPDAWPANRGGLVFLWQSAEHPNLVHDAALGAERAFSLEPSGRARLGRHHEMMIEEGAFTAPDDAGSRLLEAIGATNEITLEALVTPAPVPHRGFERVITFSRAKQRRNFTLGQRGDTLVLRLRTGPTGPNADRPAIDLFEVSPGEPVHVVVTYSPGRLAVYRDGEKVRESQEIKGSFSTHWQPGELLFGHEVDGSGRWAGYLEGVAIYNRALTSDEVAEEARRYRRILDRRQPLSPSVVDARLVRKSKIPTLQQISPYREALIVAEYEVDETIRGESPGRRVRVAQWAILDGERQPVTALGRGDRQRLVLEPYDEHPQLESVYVSDTLGGGGELFYDAGFAASGP